MKNGKQLPLFIGLLIAMAPAYPHNQETKDTLFRGLLYRAVFNGEAIPASTVNRLPEPLRVRWQIYQTRLDRFSSQIPLRSATREGPETYLWEKRKRIERSMVALIDRVGIESLAAGYAKKAILFYEWEGMSEGPLAEADYAEGYLQEHPDSMLRPYLQLFLAHRWKCARETLILEKRGKQIGTIQSKYQAQIALLRQDADLLIRSIAEDLDREAALYIDAPRLRSAEALLFPPKLTGNPTLASSVPSIDIQKALGLAEKAVEERKLNTQGQFIHAVSLEYEDGRRLYPDGKNRQGFYWYVHWRWETPRIGGDLSMRIFMDGEVVLEPHGP